VVGGGGGDIAAAKSNFQYTYIYMWI